MKRNLMGFLLLLVMALIWGMVHPAGGGPPQDTYSLGKILPADNKIAGWSKVGEPHPCSQDECLNDPQLGVRQGYPYFNRGAVAALTQSYVNNQNKDGMEVTVIGTRSISHAKVIYNELGLPAYWKGQNSLVVNMGRDNYIQGRLGRGQNDCRKEFSVGAFVVRLKYYGRPERERAVLMEFAGEIVRNIEG